MNNVCVLCLNLHLHTAEQQPSPSTTAHTLKPSLPDGTTLSQLPTPSNAITTGSPHPSMTPSQQTTISSMESIIIALAVLTGVLVVLGCVGGGIAIVCGIYMKYGKQHEPVRSKNRGTNCIL